MKTTELARGAIVRLMNNKRDHQVYVQASYGHKSDDTVFICITQPDGTASLFKRKIELINQSV